MISHDLRNPLTPVMGLASWLRRSLQEKGLEREARSAASIVASAGQMNTMIQELIESARLETGAIELRKQAIDLCQSILEIAERVGTEQDRARIRTDCPQSVPSVSADPGRIERAVVNLINNALKFSPAESLVVVKVESRDGEALVSVKDQGTGIAPEELPHLFERYYRAGATRRVEGLGLGLYITRLIVETHGGRVWVESELGKGSTFAFSLPVENAGGSE